MDIDDNETTDSKSSDQCGPLEKNCEYCGQPIETSDWYPITNRRDADGSLQLYSFCSEDCHTAWVDEQSD